MGNDFLLLSPAKGARFYTQILLYVKSRTSLNALIQCTQAECTEKVRTECALVQSAEFAIIQF